jgi:hypothetical protein
MPVIPATWEMDWEHHKFKVSPGIVSERKNSNNNKRSGGITQVVELLGGSGFSF